MVDEKTKKFSRRDKLTMRMHEIKFNTDVSQRILKKSQKIIAEIQTKVLRDQQSPSVSGELGREVLSTEAAAYFGVEGRAMCAPSDAQSIN